MILEMAVLNVIGGKGKEFLNAFSKAKKIIEKARGCISCELQRCIEKPDQYVLLIKWDKLEDHTEGFRQSPEYQEWKKLLHHFYNPFPDIKHYELIFEN